MVDDKNSADPVDVLLLLVSVFLVRPLMLLEMEEPMVEMREGEVEGEVEEKVEEEEETEGKLGAENEGKKEELWGGIRL